MKKLASFIPFGLCILLFACSSGKETASSVAQKWCDLNGKEYRAANDEEKNKARAAKESFEKEMEVKYSDKAFIEEVKKEVEKCEDASEGR